MRILHLAPYLKEGGSGRLASDLAHALQEQGETENILISPADRIVAAYSPTGIRRLTCAHPTPLSPLRSIPRLRRIIDRLKPDILMAYGGRAAWEAGMACRKMTPEERPALVGAIATFPHIGTTARGFSYCDAFATVSRHLREVLEDFSPHVRRKGAWVIPYGTIEAQCNPTYGPSGQWLKQWDTLYPNPKGSPTLCLPGAITPRHGHEDLIPLLTALHRLGVFPRVLIAGDERKADETYLKKLRQRFEEAGVADDILWIGARHDMRDVFCASDAVLSLSKEPAAYDRPILEALALGCPVVGYDHGVVGEMLRTFLPEGCVAPGRTELMADTLFQWSIYPPATMEETPYPYRMTDTAENYLALFRSLVGTGQSAGTQEEEA